VFDRDCSWGGRDWLRLEEMRLAALVSLALLLPPGCGGVSSGKPVAASWCGLLLPLGCGGASSRMAARWRWGGKLALRGGLDDDDDDDDDDETVKTVERILKRYQPEELNEATDFVSKRLRAQTAGGAAAINVGAGSIQANFADNLAQVLGVCSE